MEKIILTLVLVMFMMNNLKGQVPIPPVPPTPPVPIIGAMKNVQTSRSETNDGINYSFSASFDKKHYSRVFNIIKKYFEPFESEKRSANYKEENKKFKLYISLKKTNLNVDYLSSNNKTTKTFKKVEKVISKVAKLQ